VIEKTGNLAVENRVIVDFPVIASGQFPEP
jgi:hypothetical protein